MTINEAIQYIEKLREEHPEGCSCGSDDCLSREANLRGVDRDTACVSIVDGQLEDDELASAFQATFSGW